MKTVNIIINNQPYKATEGEYILSVCKRNGIEIPTLCNDPRLEPFSSCFVCVVQIEGMRNMQPSCSTRVQEGMVINTDNEKVRASRKTALELMLSNHYADCVAPCKLRCPAGVDVQGYISLIEKKQYSEAIKLIKQANPLPAICGRVCVRPCEVACRRNLLDEGAAVGIDYLKRFAADMDLQSENRYIAEVAPATGKKVAIIGAGPAGLSTAWFLQTKGHECHIFEAAPKAGGWLRYGIPEYRLPNDILDLEVQSITEIGTKIHYNQKLGDNLSYETIANDFDATVLTIGSQKGTLLGCKGEDAQNVFAGIDFLRDMEISGQRYNFTGKTVAVVGGGNTAMDCCRTAMRCGAKKVYVVYRRTENEMPANPIEIHESKLEGVEYLFLTNPTMVNKNIDSTVKSLTLIKMELGEPDASGRRSPVPVQGSEYELPVDYILAAIGQKTDVNFIDNINKFAKKGSLKTTRRGEIEANEHTQQTGIENVFAAGDGVSGPATIIQAISQAQKASTSCHQYLTNQTVEPPVLEFISRKDNFKKQVPDNYKGFFVAQKRQEMPVLDANLRLNFNEVELGYANEQVAETETARCLECGCTEYYTCDLKRYSTQYNAVQTRFDGDFQEHRIDFSHPFIEIDNNKCILCGRCVRICNEVVGAKALGLVERGFKTYVAPSMGGSLTQSTCESCGLCISTCPTGAITENKKFKPGPVKLDNAETICNYCGVGCSINLQHKNDFVWGTVGNNGIVNKNSNLCKYPKFGYNFYNDKNRITTPLIKRNGTFEPISFDQAYKIIAGQIKAEIDNNANAFFAGARLTNEELYLIQKLARAGAKTNRVSSFHYIADELGYFNNIVLNTDFDQFQSASKFYIIGTDLSADHAVVGFKINNLRFKHGIPVNIITTKNNSADSKKADNTINIKSYYSFIKAVNHYLLTNNKQNSFFINQNCEGFEHYKTNLLQLSYNQLVSESGVNQAQIKAFAEEYNKELNAIIVFSEKNLSPDTITELYNLALITGKLGKTANGLFGLKEKNNSQGLIDMGINPFFAIGAQPVNEFIKNTDIATEWGINAMPKPETEKTIDKLNNSALSNLFIFGEDPVGCAINKTQVQTWLAQAKFIMVSDYTLTQTAKMASLVMPASAPAETGGSFTASGKIIQQFDANLPAKTANNNIEQLNNIIAALGLKKLDNIDAVRVELFGILKHNNTNNFKFNKTTNNNFVKMFNHGCDSIVEAFDNELVEKLN